MADPPESSDTPSGQKPEGPPPVDLSRLRLRTDERGRMFILRDGHEDQQTIARRAMPWTDPNRYISLRNKDGNEVAMIESLESIPRAARDEIERYLEQATFIPRIRRIEKINLQHGYQLWDVETDAGALQLRVQEREDVRFLTETRFSVKDANGNLYEIADVNELDEQSQRELSRVV